MKIRSLQNVSKVHIIRAFSRAFKDYEIQFNDKHIKSMLDRRGFVPYLSFAAFNGDDIVAFTLNGIGDFNGISSAYDIGTGTVKEFQGMGLATKIFEHSIPYIKDKGIKQYLLEVLQQNIKAISVYNKLGFEVSREFYYFLRKNEEVDFKLNAKSFQFTIRQVKFDELKTVSGFWNFYPSWQNSFDAINRNPNNFKIFGAFIEQQIIGYCLIEPDSGDITQIAVDKKHRRKGVAAHLLKEAIRFNLKDSIKIVNTDVNYNTMTEFLKSKNIKVSGKQYEMIKKI